MILKSTLCDGCGYANCEYKGYILPQGAAITRRDSPALIAMHDPDVHLCGIECSMKWLGGELANKT